MDEYLKRTWAQVDLDAIAHNYRVVKSLVKERKVLAVVKADAYGHGAAAVSKKLQELGADYFGVAEAEEAMLLVESGITKPILIFGVTPPESFPLLLKYGLTQTAHSADYAKQLSDYAVANNSRITVHIKADTGMARLGVGCRKPESVPAAAEEIARIAGLPGLFAEGLFTHFAISESTEDDFTRKQIELFSRLIKETEGKGIRFPIRHAANSAAILNYPEAYFDMVRPGLILYGLSPDDAHDGLLRPAMALKACITSVREIEEGESVSYCRKYFAPGRRKIAVVPIGYADGYPTTLTNRGRVEIGGTSSPVVGRVCMDQMMVDVTDLPEASPWQEATILGGGIPAEEIAKKAGIISYEVVCGVGKRIPRVYFEKGKIIGTYCALHK